MVKIGFRDLEVNDKLCGKRGCISEYVNTQREITQSLRRLLCVKAHSKVSNSVYSVCSLLIS